MLLSPILNLRQTDFCRKQVVVAVVLVAALAVAVVAVVPVVVLVVVRRVVPRSSL